LCVETSARPFISGERDRERTILSPRTHIPRYCAERERPVVCLELHVTGNVLDAHRTVVRAESQIRSTRSPDDEIRRPRNVIVVIPRTFHLDCRSTNDGSHLAADIAPLRLTASLDLKAGLYDETVFVSADDAHP